MLPNNIFSSKGSCKIYKGYYPDYTPVITTLSPDSSTVGKYKQVYVYGNNFSMGSKIGYTVIKFNNITIPVTFYGSDSVSFVVPVDLPAGVYPVQVMNILYPTSFYSNIVSFTLV